MAESFTLDTSGEVGPLPAGPFNERFLTWDDIGALPYGQLAQGYIRAAFASAPDLTLMERGNHLRPVRFSDLAHATLARILKDCETALSTKLWGDSSGDGRLFWSERGAEAFSGFFGGQQDGLRALFPPLTLHLGDDGLIYFGEVG